MTRHEARRGFGPGYTALLDQLFAVVLGAGGRIVGIERRDGALTVRTEGLVPVGVAQGMVQAVERRSAATCEACGEPGERVESASEKRREVRTLCRTHAWPWIENPARPWARITSAAWQPEHDIEDDAADGVDDREDWQR